MGAFFLTSFGQRLERAHGSSDRLFLCPIGMICGRDFRNKCNLQASGPDYPLVSNGANLAIMFSFSKGLGMQNRLMAVLGIEEVVRIEVIDGEEVETKSFQVVQLPEESEAAAPAAENVPTPEAPPGTPEFTASSDNNTALASKLPPPMQQVFVNIFPYVEKTSFATLGLVGSLMLLITVIFSMAKLEDNFNTIWGVRQSRPLSRKISEYLVVLILMPIVFLAATSVNAILSSNSIMSFLAEHASSLEWLIRKSLVLLAMLFVAAGF